MGSSASYLLPIPSSTTTIITTIFTTSPSFSTSAQINSSFISSTTSPSDSITTTYSTSVSACDGFGLPYCDDITVKARIMFAVSVLRLVSKSFSLVIIGSFLRSRCAQCSYNLLIILNHESGFKIIKK